MKARHLVLAIHDHYLQKVDDKNHGIRTEGARPIDEDDAWTLQYIDLMHLQPIIEALDADTSGFVTIQEVNQFTTSRPQGWRSVNLLITLLLDMLINPNSLLHWLAFWAVGAL